MLRLLAVMSFVLVQTMPGLAQDMNREVGWSWNNQNQSLFQQGTKTPSPGVCGGYLVAGALSILTAPEIAGTIAMTKVINDPGTELARAAGTLACLKNPIADQGAIRLLQVTQCHNTRIVDFFENNQGAARASLRQLKGC